MSTAYVEMQDEVLNGLQAVWNNQAPVRQAVTEIVSKVNDLLKEARNIKYADFVTPGKELVVTAEILKQDDSLTTVKAQGLIDGNVAVNGRLVLERFNLADRYPKRRNTDPYLRDQLRAVLKTLLQPSAT